MNRAILILGPTGSGKTPLGDELQRQGWGGHRCVHFDFGERMRRLAGARTPPPGLSGDDLNLMREALESGRLLTDGEFHLVMKIFNIFTIEESVGARDLVILNGMPRHAGQVRDVAGLTDIRLVVVLEAAGETILERIRRDTGGDRVGRSDDEPDRIGERLARYEDRTRPLIAHFRALGTSIVTLPVEADTTATDLAVRLGRMTLD